MQKPGLTSDTAAKLKGSSVPNTSAPAMSSPTLAALEEKKEREEKKQCPQQTARAQRQPRQKLPTLARGWLAGLLGATPRRLCLAAPCQSAPVARRTHEVVGL